MTVQLLVDTLGLHKHGKIYLTHPDYQGIEGYRQDDFQMNGSAEFSNAFENHLQQKNATAQAVLANVQNFIGTDVEIPNLKSQAQSLHQWVSSTRPQIPVTFTVLRTREEQVPIDHIFATLIGATMPVEGSGTGLTGGLLGSPGGYRATGYKTANEQGENAFDAGGFARLGQSGLENSRPSKTWTVAIGTRFQASLLVLRNADCSMSVASCPDGSPQYGTFTLQFEPIVVPNEADVRGWFGLPPISHG